MEDSPPRAPAQPSLPPLRSRTSLLAVNFTTLGFTSSCSSSSGSGCPDSSASADNSGIGFEASRPNFAYENYIRLVVVDIETGRITTALNAQEQELRISALSENGLHSVIVLLRGDWFHSTICVGDIINVFGSAVDHAHTIIVDNEQGLLVVCERCLSRMMQLSSMLLYIHPGIIIIIMLESLIAWVYHHTRTHTHTHTPAYAQPPCILYFLSLS